MATNEEIDTALTRIEAKLDDYLDKARAITGVAPAMPAAGVAHREGDDYLIHVEIVGFKVNGQAVDNQAAADLFADTAEAAFKKRKPARKRTKGS